MVADALSRQFASAAISMVQETEWSDWEEELQRDPQLYALYQGLMTKTVTKQGYEIRGDKLLFQR